MDQRVDLFCLALLLYEMLTLEPLIDNTMTKENVKQRTSRAKQRLMRRRPKVAVEVAELLQRGVATAAQSRFASATDLEQSLRSLESAGLQIAAGDQVARWLDSIADPLPTWGDLPSELTDEDWEEQRTEAGGTNTEPVPLD